MYISCRYGNTARLNSCSCKMNCTCVCTAVRHNFKLIRNFVFLSSFNHHCANICITHNRTVHNLYSRTLTEFNRHSRCGRCIARIGNVNRYRNIWIDCKRCRFRSAKSHFLLSCKHEIQVVFTIFYFTQSLH